MRAPLFLALMLSAAPAVALEMSGGYLANPTAYIPSQCYTVTEEAGANGTGRVHNPCFTCHVRPRAPHYLNDADLQTEYSLPGPALENPWTNLFVDRSAAVDAVTDDDILAWVRRDNYRVGGRIALAERLADLPPEWDADGDGEWSGYVPDAWFAFDDEGFDRSPEGGYTGWRAFAYQPLPGAFWPANGSADDVLIRLPAAFREDAAGRFDLGIYKANLAIVEALITRTDVPVPGLDEAALGVDLDRDGVLGRADVVRFAFAPLRGETMHYVGRAGAEDRALAAGLYPQGTEFLHSVRYLDVTETGVGMAARMKELRYMQKTRWQSYYDRETAALAEAKERADFPDRIRHLLGDAERGIPNGYGWRLQGFIEDAAGDLRPQDFEETAFCIGCHGGVGVTDDDTFAFPRKLGADAFRGGWYHWTQKGLAGTPERPRADGTGEYAHYLRVNGAGDELRGNAEIIRAWIDGDTAPAAPDSPARLKPGRAEALAEDISTLLLPSPERALRLDAAYREIVRAQSFRLGRDATITPQTNVHRVLEQGQPTGVTRIEKPWFRP
ncbi:hypothetical protein [Phaeovulum vinaykumarii]|uniref:Lipoprotein n=1 Tax=Phaeovulum vinaykumarii TaxID=407234 RepID=A0A1N7K789_9RHOB|nr:hypothetical protein [Phaeovulum vinaykumarii]SIS57422.1 hypothetical protein SAMN05421795_101673 [Phaeovulum vinaykumarii]SOB93409.1 hypothetical protein SAMN05878426_101670 [Phaeovulum vinaykumarii]